jgi:signal transduction histidine kinase
VSIFERPPVRSARWWTFDVVITVLVIGLSVPVWTHTTACPLVLAVLVGSAITLPILVRRVWPIQVFGLIFVLTAAGGWWDHHLVSGPVLLVALYTVASWRPWRQAFVAAGLVEAGVIIASIVVKGGDWWYAAIFLSGMVVAALGLGLYAATRRAYLQELHDRAARLERERDQINELAVITERGRIVREMHDIVAHHLTVMVSLSDGAAAASAASPERAADVMRTVSATGRHALADTRRLLGVLSDDGMAERQPMPNLAGVDTLIAGVRAAGLPVSYEIHGAPHDIPAGAQLTVYRLVQEALTNTLKHGGAGANATVRLHYLPGELLVDIDDDGAGARAAVPATMGRGLTGMRERVTAFGGEVQSGPRLPAGWRVSAQLRLDDPAIQ